MRALSLLAIIALLFGAFVVASSVSETQAAISEAEAHLSSFAAEDALAAADSQKDENIFLEIEAAAESLADAEGDSEGDAEMEEAFGLDGEDEALFVELNSESHHDADSDAEAWCALAWRANRQRAAAFTSTTVRMWRRMWM
jgi:hypothetical protein